VVFDTSNSRVLC